MADTADKGLQIGGGGQVVQSRQEQEFERCSSHWSDHDWIVCGDGKIRRVPSAKSGICIVAHGIQPRSPEEYADSMWIVTTEKIKGRKHLLHAIGNAIVPEVAARFIRATM